MIIPLALHNLVRDREIKMIFLQILIEIQRLDWFCLSLFSMVGSDAEVK